MIAFYAGAACAQAPEEYRRQAEGFAGESAYGEALEVLNKGLLRYPKDEELRLERAKVLSWQGKYSEAEKELSGLDPNNADVILIAAQTAYYQGKLSEAEAKYRSVLEKKPAYEDARRGLERVLAAKEAAKAYLWRLDGYFGHGEYSRVDFPNQYVGGFRGTRFLEDGKAAVYGGYTVTRQYRMTDSQYEIGGARRFQPWLSGSAFVVTAPAAKFKARWEAGAGGELRLAEGKEGMETGLLAEYQRRWYPSQAADTYKAGVRLRPWGAFGVRTRAISVVTEGERPIYGWDIRTDIPLAREVSFDIGYANAGEIEQNVTARTATYFGGFSWEASKRVTVSLGFEHEDRQGSYVRDGGSLNVSYSF